MGIKQVGQGGLEQNLIDHHAGVIAVPQPRPEVDLPGLRPAGTAVAAGLQRLSHRRNRRVVLFAPTRHDKRAGMQGIEVVHMAVAAVAGDIQRNFVLPLHVLAAKADLGQRELCLRRFDLLKLCTRFAKDFARLDNLLEQLPDDGLVTGGAKRIGAVLRGIGRIAHQLAVALVLPEVIHPEQRRLEHGVVIFLEELLVHRKSVVLPDILAHPCRSRREVESVRLAGRRIAPDAVLMVDDPAAHILAVLRAVVVLCRLITAGHQAVDIVDDRQMAFGEVRLLGKPVVHLQVDIGVVVRGPGRIEPLGPDALQVRRERALARARDQQIPPELIVQRLEIPIFERGVDLVIIGEQLVGRLRRHLACPDVELDTGEQLTVVVDMRLQQRVVLLSSGGVDIGLHRLHRILVAEIVVAVIHALDIVGARAEHEQHLVRTSDRDRAGSSRHRTAGRHNLDLACKMQAVRALIRRLADQADGIAGSRDGAFDLLGGQGNLPGDLSLLACREAHHHHVAGIADKIFAGIGHAVLFIGNRHHRIAQVERTGIVRIRRRRAFVRIQQSQLGQLRRIVLRCFKDFQLEMGIGDLLFHLKALCLAAVGEGHTGLFVDQRVIFAVIGAVELPVLRIAPRRIIAGDEAVGLCGKRLIIAPGHRHRPGEVVLVGAVSGKPLGRAAAVEQVPRHFAAEIRRFRGGGGFLQNRFRERRIGQHQVAERLIGTEIRLGTLELFQQTFQFGGVLIVRGHELPVLVFVGRVILRELVHHLLQHLADLLQRRTGPLGRPLVTAVEIRIGAGAARPERMLIDLDPVVVNAAEHHAPNKSVTDWGRLILPVGGSSRIPCAKGQRVLRSLRGRYTGHASRQQRRGRYTAQPFFPHRIYLLWSGSSSEKPSWSFTRTFLLKIITNFPLIVKRNPAISASSLDRFYDFTSASGQLLANCALSFWEPLCYNDWVLGRVPSVFQRTARPI